MYLSNMQPLETDEITDILQRATPFGGVIFQQGTIHMQTSSVHRIEVRQGKLILQVLGKHQLDESHALCINLAYRNFTFRVQPQQFKVRENQIICEIPLEAKAIPSRPGGERHVLPLGSFTTAALHRIEKRDSLCSFQMKIIDVSKWGIGAYLIEPSEGGILQYDHVWVREINGEKLAPPIFCRVEYVNTRRFKDDVTVSRIGLSTDKQIPEEVYCDLIRTCRLVLSA